jgi:membrane fusion protein (multidrug efflux system)
MYIAKTIRFTALLPLLCVAALLGCDSSDQKNTPPTPKPPTVVVLPVTASTVPIYGEYVGRTDANTTVEIRARVQGVLESAHFAEGTFIRKGQLLFKIDPSEYAAKVDAAKAQLQQAESNLTAANAELGKRKQDVARLTPLAAQRAVPAQDLETAQAARDVSAANVEQSQAAIAGAKAALRAAELDLGYTTIRSPIDGIVGRQTISTDNLVGRGDNTLLTTVSNVNPILVDFSITEKVYLEIQKDKLAGKNRNVSQDVQLLLADDSVFPYKGKISVMERAVDPTTGTIIVQSKFPNPQNLIRPGQFGRVRVLLDERENTVTIPQKAVQELQGVQTVLVVDDNNKTELRTVALGERVGANFVVSDGLKAGERIVVEGLQKVRPGMIVSPQAQAISAEPNGGH